MAPSLLPDSWSASYMLRQPCSDEGNSACCCDANFFIWRVAPYGRSDSIKDYRVLHLPFLAVCAKQVQMNYRPIVFPWSLMILGALMHQDLWANLKRMKNAAVLCFWHLYLVFIHANWVSCSSKTTKRNTMSWTQRREGHSCCSFSVTCFSRGHPRVLGKLLLTRRVAN